MARKVPSFLYLDERYRRIKRSLSKEDKEKIGKIEKLCLDTRLNYFEVSREVETMIWGPFPRHFTLEDIHQLKTPLAELADYLLRRAGHIRGIQFSDEVGPAIWQGPVCGECKADIGETGFHADGCSDNDPYKSPIDLKALREFLKGKKKRKEK